MHTAARLCACALLVISCSDEPTAGNAAVASVGILESNVLVGLNGTQTLTPIARDDVNRPIAGVVFTWSSSDESVATVDNNGVVHGLRLGGPVTVTATSAGKTGSIPILVTPGGVVVAPGVASLLAGQSAQFTASAVDANGVPMTGLPVQWSLAFNANSLTAATISPTGLVTANSAGIITVKATVAGKTGSTSFGVPSVYDGGWDGIDGASRPIHMEVRFGLVVAFRIPTIPQSGCTDKSIDATVQGPPIAADGTFEYPIPTTGGVMPVGPGAPTAVRGTFVDATLVRGNTPALDLGPRTCANGATQPGLLSGAAFSATHQ